MPNRARLGRPLAVLVAVGAALAVAACGQKGPLYLPDKAEAVQPDQEGPLTSPDQTSPEPQEEKQTPGTGY